MNTQLTKSTQAFLCLIYREYLKRIKCGESRQQAKRFTGPDRHPFTLYNNADQEDIREALRELKRAGLAKVYLDGGFVLDNAAIIYMENLFPSGLADIASCLANLSSFVSIFLR